MSPAGIKVDELKLSNFQNVEFIITLYKLHTQFEMSLINAEFSDIHSH